jgi:two-component system, NarL family, nitrate/nitrite response regulator NarL
MHRCGGSDQTPKANMSNEAHVRVLVVDDHVGIRIGIANLINAEQPRLCCAGTAATGVEALARTRELQPHVVVLDVNLDGEDGLALIPALQQAAPCVVVVLTSLVDPHVATQALRVGATACLHKTAPAAELMAAIFAARPAVDWVAPAAPVDEGGVLSRATGTKHPQPLGKPANALGNHPP